MAYFLSPALVQLRAEINTLWPGRDKASDGWIGDLAHASRGSDHNPDGDGSVNAIDVDKDGIDPELLRQAAMADPRCSYVIWAGRIWRRANSWKQEVYSGTNGHYHHLHISILHGASVENNRSSWGLATARATPVANVISAPLKPAKPAPAKPKPALLTSLILEDDMIRIQAPGRGIALIGPGYYRPLVNTEEVAAAELLMSKHMTGNDREFDVWVSLASAGTSAPTPTR